ncbi:MAG: nitrate oxidoreductase subunit beta, partial [Chloroflexi bacterium]|nr:nitrate oxidoreductase subunit beta [Chloroflexota bacterium]
QEYMWWNNVETKPYGGYPQFYDVKTLSLLEKANPGGQVWDASAKRPDAPYGRYEGATVFEAAHNDKQKEEVAAGYIPADEEWRAPNIYEDTATGSDGAPGVWPKGTQLPVHDQWFFYLQRLCNHCSYPACLSACPRKAIYKRPEDGIVLIDQKRCRGYRKCVEQCPYKRPMFNTTTGVSEKCIACYPRVEGKDPLSEGQPMETRCMTACVGKIRMQGLVKKNEEGNWAEDRYNPLYYLVKVEKVALPLYPQFGTEPNGYYIPPRWVYRPYLKQMFGPGVDDAIARYMAPSRELLAVLQLFRTTQKIIFRYEIKEGPKIYEAAINGQNWEMYDDTVIGYDAAGKEATRVKVQEDVYVRDPQYLNSI